jgi:hypothetical protein
MDRLCAEEIDGWTTTTTRTLWSPDTAALLYQLDYMMGMIMANPKCGVTTTSFSIFAPRDFGRVTDPDRQ